MDNEIVGRIVDECIPLCNGSAQELILEMLSESSSDNRVTRAELADRLHMRDRNIRDTINTMRKRGIPIASSSDKAGYYIPGSLTEYLEFSRDYRSRANDIYLTEKTMCDKMVEVVFGQVKIGDGI